MIIKTKGKEYLYEWHTWFAWHPVRIEDGVWVWMQKVERKYIAHAYGESVEYLLIEK